LKEHVAQLKDGTEVLIRPLRIEDLDQPLAFFQKLPPEDMMCDLEEMWPRLEDQIEKTDWPRLG